MIFGGLQKLTLLDYAGKVACIVFTKGCNFCCPFCHNSSLINGSEGENISSDYIIEYLKKRKGILEGVCITGGEPLLHKEIEDFMREVKSMGYSVKLDTNGSNPERLKQLVREGLVDYVAMDIKNSYDKYSLTAGCDRVDMRAIEESIDFLLSGEVDYEFRTTVVKELHTPEDIEQIAKRIEGAKRYFLQNFLDSGAVVCENLSPQDADTLGKMLISAQRFVKTAQIRGQS